MCLAVKSITRLPGTAERHSAISPSSAAVNRSAVQGREYQNGGQKESPCIAGYRGNIAATRKKTCYYKELDVEIVSPAAPAVKPGQSGRNRPPQIARISPVKISLLVIPYGEGRNAGKGHSRAEKGQVGIFEGFQGLFLALCFKKFSKIVNF